MKIGYFIYSNKYGTGGHHHSLKATSDAVSSLSNADVYIYNFGVAPSPVLADNVNYYFFKINEFTILFKLIKVLFICYNNKLDVLHAFDVNAYFYVRVISFFLNISSVYTKCGGSNNKYNPQTDIAITFSGENYTYLKKQNFHKKIYLIENRVPTYSQDNLKIKSLRKKYNSQNKFTFLRIIRISKYYETSIINTIKFVSKFGECKLFLVGSVYNVDLYNKVLKLARQLNVDMEVLKDTIYTKNAKELLDLGDCVFGSGRAAMEAMFLNKMLLSFVKSYNYPIVVDEQNFKSFRYFNFSERVEVNGKYYIEKEISKIKNKEFMKKNSIYLGEMFKKYYLVETAIPNYISLYKEVSENKKSSQYFLDFLKNFYFHFLRSSVVLKYFIG